MAFFNRFFKKGRKTFQLPESAAGNTSPAFSAGHTPYKANNTACSHEWIPVRGEWTEKCTKCGVTEPARFRQHEEELLFPMACIPDSDIDVILTAMQMKYMVRTVVDGAQNEFRRVHDNLKSSREYMLNKNEWNSVFLSLTTYASTTPEACPPMFAALLIPEKQQHIKKYLFNKWMSVI